MPIRFSVLALAALLPYLTSGGQEQLVPTSRDADAIGAPFVEDDDRQDLLAFAQDRSGKKWAAVKEQGMKMEVLDSLKWKTISPKGFPSTLRAKGITTLADGTIACLWHDESTAKDHLVTRHTDSGDSLLVKLDVTLKQPRLLPLLDGGLLITHSGREVVRIKKDGSSTHISLLPESVFLPPKAQSDGSVPEEHAAVHAVEHEGALWLWCPALQDLTYFWRLRGLVKLTPTECKVVSLGAMQKNNEPISVVTPWRNDHLAIAVAGRGLVSYDIRGNHQHHIKIEEAGSHIERIFMAGGKWHFVACPKPDEVQVEVSKSLRNQLLLITKKFYDPEKRTSILFEVREGKDSVLSLHSRTWKLDSEPRFKWWDRPLLATKAGFWIATHDGISFFPSAADSQPVAFPGRAIQQMFPVAEKHMLTFDDQGRASLRPSSAEKAPEPARIEWLNTRSLLVESADGGLLGVLKDGKFHCWSKDGWKELETPKSVLDQSQNVLAAGPENQAWWFPLEDGPAAICDLTTGKWRTFKDIRVALEKNLKPGAALALRDWPGFSPRALSKPPARITFLRSDGSIHLFDGRKWHQWHVHEIAGEEAKASGGPYFDSKGRLTISIEWKDHQLADDMKWTNSGRTSDHNTRLHHSDESQPPPGCPVKRVACTAYDRLGVCWLVDDRKHLWKCFQGAAVRLMDSKSKDDPSHGGGFLIYEAHVTSSGEAFLRTSFDWANNRYLAVRPLEPPPISEARVTKVNADAAEIRFGDAAWHVWRIDEGNWSAASSARSHALTGLVPGAHQMEVLALNRELTPAAKPARLSITIQKAADEELDTLIKELGGAELDASEVAARRLRSQGESIIPFLRQRQKSSSERQQWWIDAIIQSIEKQAGN